MYWQILQLLRESGGELDWEACRNRLNIADYGDDFMSFNEAWGRALDTFVSEGGFDDEEF